MNSKSKTVKIVGYVVYAFLFLIILGAVLPNHQTETTTSTAPEPTAPTATINKTATPTTEEACMDATEAEIRIEHAAMQFGVFKSFDTRISEYEHKFKVNVEPASTLTQADMANFAPIIYGAIDVFKKMNPCKMNDTMQTVEITVKLPDYNYVITYPWSIVASNTSISDYAHGEIVQR